MASWLSSNIYNQNAIAFLKFKRKHEECGTKIGKVEWLIYKSLYMYYMYKAVSIWLPYNIYNRNAIF